MYGNLKFSPKYGAWMHKSIIKVFHKTRAVLYILLQVYENLCDNWWEESLFWIRIFWIIESPDLVHKTGLNESFLNLPDSGLQFITDSFLMSSEDEWINFTTWGWDMMTEISLKLHINPDSGLLFPLWGRN